MIIQFNELVDVRRRHQHEKIVLVGGCYDLIHVGHVEYLKKCKGLGDILVVAASSDVRIKQRKGSTRPIISDTNRVIMLSELKCVDYALVAPTPVSTKAAPTVLILECLRPNIFATSDERFEDYKENLEYLGIQVQYVPEIRLTSTTEIIHTIKNGDSVDKP